VTTEATWRDVRALRADPPGLAASDEKRRGIFAAALQQAEELHGASAVAGYASQPLPLFYALSQGGRAIAAVRVPGEDWAYHGHGLKAPPEQTGNDAMAFTVQQTKQGAFPIIAETTGSAHLAQVTSLGALLATLPEVAALVAPHVDHSPALPLFPDHETTSGPYASLAPPRSMSAVYFGPEAQLPSERQLEAMGQLLAPFPRAQGWAIRPTEAYRNGRFGVGLYWPIEEGSARGYKALDVVATRFEQTYFLRPGLGKEGEEMNLLMTWWASLFALSALARYEPARWRAALDVESSALGVVLEDVLDVAQARVPTLLYEAITEELALAELGQN
jgi:hypothetical protein